ncbi:hypothetical protein [Collimonas sp.]|uniref:hypothetical protein n=1 Tax=Collimonas sp. TaxID=1963772 RepID=UPI002B78201B|nr:hypothetical protein [Collimonas sp.]HWW05933.1 hypothetical protein [Collimonas sp.]
MNDRSRQDACRRRLLLDRSVLFLSAYTNRFIALMSFKKLIDQSKLGAVHET